VKEKEEAKPEDIKGDGTDTKQQALETSCLRVGTMGPIEKDKDGWPSL